MKTVLGVIGSPRKLGNCELLVKEIAARLGEPADLRMVRLPEKNILPCKACYRCLTGNCPLADDFGPILDAIAAADGVIVAAPAYLHGAHSSIQRFLDRGLQFWRRIDELEGKPAVGVATAGMEDGEGFALLGVENFIQGMGMTLKGRAVVRAALPGEALLSEEGRGTAVRLGRALFGAAEDAGPAGRPACTDCGGSFFEFRGGRKVYCLLCGASGEVEPGGDGGLRLTTRPPSHAWRAGAARKAHGQWLIDMKKKYVRERDRLKDLTKAYAGGTFI